MSGSYFVYVKFRPWNGQPFYVGKGKGNRHLRDNRGYNPHYMSIVAKAGGDVPTVIVRDGLSEDDAFRIERALIAAIGRKAVGGTLCNMTDGGEGPTNLDQEVIARANEKRRERLTPELRERLGARHKGNQYRKGKKASAETIERLRLSHLGKRQSPETIEKKRRANTGKKRSAEFCEALGARCRGKTLSAERRRAISAVQIGKKLSDEHKRKITEASLRRYQNPDARKKMVEMARIRWDAYKAGRL